MRVASPLADIDFHVGRISRHDDGLLIESRADSSLPTRVIVSPDDARQVLKVLLRSPGVLGFALGLLFRRGAGGAQSGDDAWRRRRTEIGVNKPW